MVREGKGGARVVLSILHQRIKAPGLCPSVVRLLAVYVGGTSRDPCAASVDLGPRWPPSWQSLDHLRWDIEIMDKMFLSLLVQQ